MRPAMTGETEKGRSISAIKRDRPLNRNFVTDHAAASPKTILRGITVAAIPVLSRIELRHGIDDVELGLGPERLEHPHGRLAPERADLDDSPRADCGGRSTR